MREKESSIYIQHMYKRDRERKNGRRESNKCKLTFFISSFLKGIEMDWLLFNDRFSVWSRKGQTGFALGLFQIFRLALIVEKRLKKNSNKCKRKIKNTVSFTVSLLNLKYYETF